MADQEAAYHHPARRLLIQSRSRSTDPVRTLMLPCRSSPDPPTGDRNFVTDFLPDLGRGQGGGDYEVVGIEASMSETETAAMGKILLPLGTLHIHEHERGQLCIDPTTALFFEPCEN
jgi:hypothetical protein